jgi:uncharacterized protein (TIGR03085 family)
VPARRARDDPIAYDLDMTYAKDERLALCALLAELGPDQPTLCTGWRTVDLAAHLVLRERRPDAGAGILGGPLAAYTRRVQARLAQQTSFADLIQMIKTGPPRLSFFALPGMDERANTVEYFVHHEDARRAQPGWVPRELSPEFSDLLWSSLRMARLMLRRAPVGVELIREDGQPADGRPVRMTVRARTPVVTIAGTPAELTMWAMGRTGAARVRLDGADADVAALKAAHWRL